MQPEAAIGTDGDRLAAALANKPDGVVETIAGEAGVSPRAVLAALPDGQAVVVPADRWDTVWESLTGWDEVLLIVHTATVVLEVTGSLPAGSSAHGWFNIHGDSPIGGHIRRDACAGIAFVDRPFHGRRSCSVWFLDGQGSAMFKVFVPRGPDKALKPMQLSAFEALRVRAAD